MATTAEQPLVMVTVGTMQEMLNAAVLNALEKLREQDDAEKRLTSAQAAEFLGCTTDHLQKLHRRGLPYEKGKPNRYRLADLKKQRQHQLLDKAAS